MNTCFILVLFVIAVAAADVTPWTGPLAQHTLGQLVEDTPEVAAAKRLHAEMFSQIRSILPELTHEEQISGDVHEPNFVPQVSQFPQHVTAQPQIPSFPVDPNAETRPQWTGPFADHKLGEQVRETVDVAAARKFHEDVYSRVRAALPQLPPEHEKVSVPTKVEIPQVPQVQRFPEVDAAHARAIMERIAQLKELLQHPTTTTAAPPVFFNWEHPVDTPEVAAAKAEHAKAYAAILGH